MVGKTKTLADNPKNMLPSPLLIGGPGNIFYITIIIYVIAMFRN